MSDLLSRRGIQLALLWLPVLPVLTFIAPFDIRVPVLDQWDLIGIFERIVSGEISFGDFYALQNKTHRMIFPRIVFAALAFASNWSIRLELYLNVLLAATGLAVVLHISRVQAGREWKPFLVAGVLSSFLVFSLAQWFNWQWGFAASIFMVDTFVCLGLLALTLANPSNPIRPLLVAAACCLISSYSMAAGLLSWWALLPSVLVLGLRSGTPVRIMGLWFLFAGLIWGSYFMYGLQPMDNRPLPLRLTSHPVAYLTYFFSLLGSAASSGYCAQAKANLGWMAPAGILITLVFAGLSIGAWLQRERLGLERIAPWISLGTFSLLYAAANLVARGRPDYVNDPISDFVIRGYGMYLTPSSLLTLAVIQLALLVGWAPRIGHSSGSDEHSIGPSRMRWASWIAYLAIAALLGNFAFSAWQAFVAREKLLDHYANGALCLQVRTYLADRSSCAFHRYGREGSLNSLEELGFRSSLQSIEFDDTPTEEMGTLDTLTVEGTIYSFEGTLSPRALALPDAAILIGKAGTHRFFKLRTVHEGVHPVKEGAHTWQMSVRRSWMPHNLDWIEAWFFDPSRAQATRLSGELKLERRQRERL